jgi:hypothetical protein
MAERTASGGLAMCGSWSRRRPLPETCRLHPRSRLPCRQSNWTLRATRDILRSKKSHRAITASARKPLWASTADRQRDQDSRHCRRQVSQQADGVAKCQSCPLTEISSKPQFHEGLSTGIPPIQRGVIEPLLTGLSASTISNSSDDSLPSVCLFESLKRCAYLRTAFRGQ